MAGPRLTKADEKVTEEFGFEFAEAPVSDNTRRSRYDALWTNARTLCMKFPGKTLKVRVHNNPSAAYADAKAINNGDKHAFKEDYSDWTAKAALSGNPEEVYAEGHDKAGEPLTAVYLTYTPQVESAE